MNLQFSPKNIFYSAGSGNSISGLNALKLLCAFFVVQIHASSCLRPCLSSIIRVAVPIFFMITGYFLLDNNGQINEKIAKKKVIKALRFTIGWQCFYLAVNCLVCFVVNPNGITAALPHSRMDWISFVFVGNFSNGAFWYLNSLVISLAAIWLIAKLKIDKILHVLLVGGIIYALFGENYFSLNYNPINSAFTRNFIGIGIPAITIGILLRRHQDIFVRHKKTFMAIGIITVAVGSLEHFCIHPTGVDVRIMSFPMAIFLFAGASCCTFGKNIDRIAKIGEQHSSNIFTLHMLILLIPVIYLFVPRSILSFVVFIASIFLSMAFIRSKKFISNTFVSLKTIMRA